MHLLYGCSPTLSVSIFESFKFYFVYFIFVFSMYMCSFWLLDFISAWYHIWVGYVTSCGLVNMIIIAFVLGIHARHLGWEC